MIWGPSTDPSAEMEEMQREDANPPWNARERTQIKKMVVTSPDESCRAGVFLIEN